MHADSEYYRAGSMAKLQPWTIETMRQCRRRRRSPPV